jgi:filamentous hemagglutinin family protein
MNMSSDVDRRKSGVRVLCPLVVSAAIGCFGSAVGIANPLGPQVVNGQVGFAQQGNTLVITNSPNSIINWQSFSINSGEITRFIQQNPNSSVLNRIVGQDPSRILGALQSNGRVFLLNPNGIIFGQGARVDVNGLVASTLNLSNQDFLAGKMNFSVGDKTAGIQNHGAINTPSGGQIYLIASNVENTGIMTSPQGDVILAAGHTVKLADSANPDLHIVVSADESRAVNVGQIIAQGGKIGIYGALVNQRGIVSANSLVAGENGRIVFKASRDTVLESGSRTTATGAGKGGDIRILGERVALTGNARVDASGNTGGGTVLVGGDYQGRNPDIRNAQQSYVSADVVISADAMQRGNGGKVIVWADDVTRVFGSISARGGVVSGNGGFVETSGHHLDMQGYVDTRAPNGTTGTFLLDPTNIYIANDQASATVAGMTGSDNSASTGPSPFVASGSVGDSLLSVGTLQSALASSSVVVSTANASGTGTGVITVVDPVAWSSGNNLTLSANSDILVNAAISGGAGGVTLNAPAGGIFGSGMITAASLTAVAWGGIGQSSPLSTQVGSLNVNNTGSDTNINIANNGALTILAATQSFGGSVGQTTVTTTGALTVAGPVTAGAGSITLAAGTTAPYQLTISGPGSVNCGSGNITLTAGGAILGTTGTVVSASGSVTQHPNQSEIVALPPAAPSSAALSQVVQQAINSTVNVINTSTSSGAPVVVSPATNTSSSASTVGQTDTTPDDKKSDVKSDEKKSDDKKESKADSVVAKDNGAKKDEPVRKLYCN